MRWDAAVGVGLGCMILCHCSAAKAELEHQRNATAIDVSPIRLPSRQLSRLDDAKSCWVVLVADCSSCHILTEAVYTKAAPSVPIVLHFRESASGLSKHLAPAPSRFVCEGDERNDICTPTQWRSTQNAYFIDVRSGEVLKTANTSFLEPTDLKSPTTLLAALTRPQKIPRGEQ